jgi:hypothetical protein
LSAIAASCSAASHCRSNELQPAAGLATAERCTFVWLPSDVRLTFVLCPDVLRDAPWRPTYCCHAWCALTSYAYLPDVLRNNVLQSCVLHSMHCGRASCGVVSYSLSCCILMYYCPVIREIQTIHCVRIL